MEKETDGEGALSLFLKPLSEKEFDYLSDLVFLYCGINLHRGKKEMVRARLCKRLRELGLGSFEEYCEHVQSAGAEELTILIDTLSTNYTFFFREPKQFEFLDKQLPRMLQQKEVKKDRKFRIWSAGCSSGEEPYSIALLLAEALERTPARIDAKILATDVSSKVMERAMAGVYDERKLERVSDGLRRKYFERRGNSFAVRDELKKLVAFRYLNIVGPWPFQGRFHAVFCRNVMIYFDRNTQQELVQRYYDCLHPDGYLFLGHSESLINVRTGFRYIQPALYQKK